VALPDLLEQGQGRGDVVVAFDQGGVKILTGLRVLGEPGGERIKVIA